MDDGEERQTVAQKMLFNDLCAVFNEIKVADKQQKRHIFDRFLRRWNKQVVTTTGTDGFDESRTDDSFYPAMRLFVPSKDVGNRKFEIKEARLNHLVTKAMDVTKLEKKFEDRKEVLVEKLVAKVDTMFFVATPKLTIADVNDYLDRIDRQNQIRTQEEAMRKLCSQCTTNELRWLFHIILGDIEYELGKLNAHTIMEWFYPGADNLWKSGNSLLQICGKCFEEESAAIGTAREVAKGNLLCKPFRPMLLARLEYNKYCLPKIIKHCHRPFYVEVKYDGEHLLLHKYECTNYRYYTRNGVDYTHKMGDTNERLLSKRVHPYFRPEVRDCVLDCELLIWDRKKQEFLGKNKRASDGNVYDPKHLDEDFFENHTQFDRSLAVFDILYLNGRCLIQDGLTLKDRMRLLGGLEGRSEIFKAQDRSAIFVSPKQLIQSVHDFTEYYKKAMREGEEGIVVKGLDTHYRTGSRAERNGCFKVKPDYGIQSGMDLAIVGVRYENPSLGHIKSFLVAARLSGQGPDLRFKIVAGITSRLKKIDYQRLMGALGETEELLEHRPDWVEGNGGEKNGKNDRFLPREQVQVVEVRASGLLNGRLQFPSIRAVRSDKPLDEIDSVQDVLHFDQRLRSRPIIAESDRFEANVLLNRKRRFQLTVPAERQLAPTNDSDKGRYSQALNGRKVCVLNASGPVDAHELQKILVGLGATPIANPNSDMAFAVAMEPKKFTVVSQIKANRVNIVHGNWLLRCKERGTLLPWQESDMVHRAEGALFSLFTLPEEEEGEQQMEVEEGSALEGEMGQNGTGEEGGAAAEEEVGNGIGGGREEGGGEADRSGRTTPSSLGTFDMGQMADEAEREEQQIAAELMDKLDSADCQAAETGNLFTDFVFFLHESVHGDRKRNDLCRKIEQESGQISNELDGTVTHVVIDKMRSGQEKPLFDWNERQQWTGQFVGAQWVDKAIEEEDRYRLHDRIHEFIQY